MLNIKNVVLGAGVLLVWTFLASVLRIPQIMPVNIFIAVGLVPAYYLGKIGGVSGYVGMYVVIWMYATSYSTQVPGIGA